MLQSFVNGSGRRPSYQAHRHAGLARSTTRHRAIFSWRIVVCCISALPSPSTPILFDGVRFLSPSTPPLFDTLNLLLLHFTTIIQLRHSEVKEGFLTFQTTLESKKDKLIADSRNVELQEEKLKEECVILEAKAVDISNERKKLELKKKNYYYVMLLVCFAISFYLFLVQQLPQF